MKEKVYQHIEDLLTSKSFEELTCSEKQLVERHLSKLEYEYYSNQFNSLLNFYEKKEENIAIREGVKKNLLDEFDSKFEIRSSFFDRISNLLFKPITYQISGIGVAVLLIFFYVISEKEITAQIISDDEFIKYTQFLDMEMPASTTTEQLENMVFLEEF